jgi:predicted metal-dependent peptidase
MWPYSKKHIHRGFFMPSVGIEAPGHIVFAVDTSGSMSTEDLSDIFTEIRIYRETYPCRLTVIQADADIQSITTYEEMDGEEIPKKVKISEFYSQLVRFVTSKFTLEIIVPIFSV